MNDKYILESPNGVRIRGTLETIEALNGIYRIKPHPETGFTYEEDEERTELGSVEEFRNERNQVHFESELRAPTRAILKYCEAR